jgi:hypothetical protein
MPTPKKSVKTQQKPKPKAPAKKPGGAKPPKRAAKKPA